MPVFSDAGDEEKAEERLDDLDEDELDDVSREQMVQISALHFTLIMMMETYILFLKNLQITSSH